MKKKQQEKVIAWCYIYHHIMLFLHYKDVFWTKKT